MERNHCRVTSRRGVVGVEDVLENRVAVAVEALDVGGGHAGVERSHPEQIPYEHAHLLDVGCQAQ